MMNVKRYIKSILTRSSKGRVVQFEKQQEPLGNSVF